MKECVKRLMLRERQQRIMQSVLSGFSSDIVINMTLLSGNSRNPYLDYANDNPKTIGVYEKRQQLIVAVMWK